jgi:hypothetical protein
MSSSAEARLDATEEPTEPVAAQQPSFELSICIG